MYNYQSLKQKHRELREQLSAQLSLRIHRSLSWLNKAEQSNDMDSQFIFSWIAFNAAYAKDLFNCQSERDQLKDFLQLICQLDQQKHLYRLIWQQFPKAIRTLLENQFVYQPFWNYYNQYQLNDWRVSFEREKQQAYQALAQQNTIEILHIIFSRLYTLRNQLVHGGATWNSAVNRSQIRDACGIMMNLVPIIIDIMLDNPTQQWGEVFYPVIED
ncbi:HEPN domain-containing protein [Volucribacter amazonae]|uniref:Apea-like HEPN domain-containing protein n=1 Tax=Volucribacter amazonae TaxID=256731 RepID=A0A9X4PD24_9PAST|nr:HEPN domain-containing protein [Volucribacter amazonae]MDG6896062.1 hypothetical protein [Volucribacter amazonae]